MAPRAASRAGFEQARSALVGPGSGKEPRIDWSIWAHRLDECLSRKERSNEATTHRPGGRYDPYPRRGRSRDNSRRSADELHWCELHDHEPGG